MSDWIVKNKDKNTKKAKGKTTETNTVVVHASVEPKAGSVKRVVKCAESHQKRKKTEDPSKGAHVLFANRKDGLPSRCEFNAIVMKIPKLFCGI